MPRLPMNVTSRSTGKATFRASLVLRTLSLVAIPSFPTPFRKACSTGMLRTRTPSRLSLVSVPDQDDRRPYLRKHAPLRSGRSRIPECPPPLYHPPLPPPAPPQP